MADLAEIATLLSSRRTGVLAGAGVSLHSGVPIVSHLIPALLDSVGMSADQRARFLRVNPPFERTVEALLDGAQVGGFFNVFAARTPTRTHRFIAGLAALGRVVALVTTNFDDLLERAIQPHQALRTSFDPRQFDRLRWTKGQLDLVKIHGHIGAQASLVATIRSVASSTHLRSRRRVLVDLLESDFVDCLLVVGYSSSDRFDVLPAIKAVRNPRLKVIFLNHRPVPRRRVDIVPLASIAASTPFSHLDGMTIDADTDFVVARLWPLLLGSPAPRLRSDRESWRNRFAIWQDTLRRQHGEGVRPFLAGRLLKIVDDYTGANQALEEASRLLVEPRWLGLIHQAKADNYRDLGTRHSSEAMDSLRAALRYFVSARDLRGQGEAWNSIGILFEDLADHARAIASYRHAKRFARRVRDVGLLGRCCGNLGIAYKNSSVGQPRTRRLQSLSIAFRYHLFALRCAVATGDLKSAGRSLGNLAITISDMGDPAGAIPYYEMARNIASQLGDTRHEAIWAANAGMDLVQVNPPAARPLLERAIEVFAELGHTEYVEYCQSYLSKTPA